MTAWTRVCWDANAGQRVANLGVVVSTYAPIPALLPCDARLLW